jgi:predicted O-methyltransferase YrrM/SAM-dependent methyltransferase
MDIFVSLTSIQQNQQILLLTLNSIEQQSLRPTKCYIYLSEEPYLQDIGFKDKILDESLQNYLNEKADLFEVKWCLNTGPFRKLVPLLTDKFEQDCIIITLDDDTVYHPELIQHLMADYQIHQCCINYRGFTMKYQNSIKEINYEDRAKTIPCNLYNFHTGKSGVLYHTSFFRSTKGLILNEKLFLSCCPTGDDIWFNFCRIANDIKCYVTNFNYMIKDQTNQYGLFSNYNVIHQTNSIAIQKTIAKLIELGYLFDQPKSHFSSASYWEQRYARGGNSGLGSYNDSAIFKSNLINDLITRQRIESMIDFGVGDGNLLKSLKPIDYIGLDVSPTIIEKCKFLFSEDTNKQFFLYDEFNMTTQKDLTMSCDVLYHLVEDQIYYQYLDNLFNCSKKAVIIYGADVDKNEAPHVLKRKFTNFISIKYPQWQLSQSVMNTKTQATLCIYLKTQNLRIPQILLQTSPQKPQQRIIDNLLSYCPGWNYIHFIDDECVQFFKDYPLEEFTNIAEQFKLLSNGAHKADLFRYYYLYIKGGVFIDSDAMLEMNIDNIILNYQFVSVKSYHTNRNLIFNGFLATPPLSLIIYEALKLAYSVNNQKLCEDYHLFCSQLHSIWKQSALINTHLYQEIKIDNFNYDTITINENNQVILRHYCQTKIIPETPVQLNSDHSSIFQNIYLKKLWKNGSGPGSSIRNTKQYIDKVRQFITDPVNQIQTIVDLGCGDWQFSPLIYQDLDIKYIGYDCASSVIEDNRVMHPHYNFQSLDFLSNKENIPDADLYILKDVLQHWKLNDIYTFLDYLTLHKQFKWILITNSGQQTKHDTDIKNVGECRHLNSNYYPLKKYANPFFNYIGDETKHVCLIKKKNTTWSQFNFNEINEFPLSLLNVYELPNQKIRLGSQFDGGYTILEGFKYSKLISCGISHNTDFEEQFVKHYDSTCIAFDGTINKLPRLNPKIEFIKKNIDPNETESTTNLKKYIGDATNLFLKMDIESSEFDWIQSVETDLLTRFTQIAIEVHWPYDSYRWKLFSKLNQTHYLCHIHGNNNGDLIPIPNQNFSTFVNLPEVMELTYINKLAIDSQPPICHYIAPLPIDHPNRSNIPDLHFSINDVHNFNEEAVIQLWGNYIKRNLISLVGKTPEGNIYSTHRTTQKSPFFIPKQHNIVRIIKLIQPQQVLEIGFNAGFSALLMKMSDPQIFLTCIDINEHSYVIPCYDQICQHYHQINLIPQPSKIGLQQLIDENARYDLIHIDGDHRIEGATLDFEMSLKLSHSGTIIIMDDTNLPHLSNLCDQYIHKGVVREYLFDQMKLTKYQHRFLIVV